MKIKALIIDDEKHARMLLEKYLQAFDQIELIGTYSNGFDGLVGIQKHKPNLIFLDIQMPKLNGFEVLEALEDRPHIIFSTAYDEFAIKAFDYGAADYLLKPYSQERLNEAVNRALAKGKNNVKATDQVLAYVDEEIDYIQRIVVKSKSSIQIIPTDDIHYLEAQDDYVLIHSHGGEFLKEKTMKYFEEHLNHKEFVRVHRSFIVRIDQISKMENYEKNQKILILKSGAEVNVSRQGFERLRNALNI